MFIYASPTSVIYPLSLHDALPICPCAGSRTSTAELRRASRSIQRRELWLPVSSSEVQRNTTRRCGSRRACAMASRSEEHTSELQSRRDLVCRLLLEKKKIYNVNTI